MLSGARQDHVFLKDGWGTGRPFFWEGLSHITSGYVHLVFLLSLLSAALGISRWLWVLTSFTLAHDVTYSLATVGYFQVQAELIEPVIALTIVLTAALNLWRIRMRLDLEMATVFALGLFHGLGFASAMATATKEVRYPVSSVLGFNLGIEVGQVLVALVLGCFLFMLQQRPLWLSRATTGIAWAPFFVGSFWFFERI